MRYGGWCVLDQPARQALVFQGRRCGGHAHLAYFGCVRIACNHVGEPTGEQALGCRLRGAPDAAVERSCGQLHQRPGRDQWLDPGRIGLDLAVSLWMGEQGLEPGHPQLEEPLLEVERPARIGKLHEQVAAGLPDREPLQLLARETSEAVEGDLAAVQYLDLDPVLVEVTPHARNACLHRLDAGRIVRADVRGGGDRPHAVLQGRTSKLTAVRERGGPVVESGQDVRMEVDHGL